MNYLTCVARRTLVVLSLVSMAASSGSLPARAGMLISQAYTTTNAVISWPLVISSEANATDEVGDKLEVQVDVQPEPEKLPVLKIIKTIRVPVTAYGSNVWECDSDPFVTADGSVVRDGIVAANFLPFGTKFRMPEYTGDKVYEVRDRMNQRYTYRIDVWMDNDKDTRAWGIKRNAKVEIIVMGDNKHKWNDPDMKEARKLVANKK